MSKVDPFSSRFEVFGREARQVVPDINGRAFELLLGRLTPNPGADGRVILLKAPRAGFGKTLLIQRVAETLTSDHHFVKVGLIGGRTIEASAVLECVLESLCHVLPASEGLTMLDLVARRIIARGLEPLVRSGEVPCQDRDGALLALQQTPVETFDFHHEGAVTAHWTEANFEILGPRLAAEVAQVSGASLREAAYWVELFFRFATTSPENVERSRLLFETVFRPEGLRPSESGAGERLHGLLSLMGIATTAVLVIDDTEGLSTHPPDALELASFLTNLAQSCPGTLVLLSVNADVWDTAFAPRLPGGLADRLTEHEVSLQSLSRESAESIIRSRGGQRASEVLERMDWSNGELYARRVLKDASLAWEGLMQEAAEQVEAAGSKTDGVFGTLDDLAKLESTKPDLEDEVGWSKPDTFSASAALLAAAAGAAGSDKSPDGGEEAPSDSESVEAEEQVGEKAFDAASYATPSSPLTEAGEAEEISPPFINDPAALARLAAPTEPLVPDPFDQALAADTDEETTGDSADFAAEEAIRSPFAPAGSVAPTPTAPAEGPVSPETDIEESDQGTEDAAKIDQKVSATEGPDGPFTAVAPGISSFQPLESETTTETAAETEMPQEDGDSADGTIDPPATESTNPFFPVAPPRSPFASVWDKGEESEAPQAEVSDEPPGEEEDAVRADEVGPVADPFKAGPAAPFTPSPSPFAPVRSPSKSAESETYSNPFAAMTPRVGNGADQPVVGSNGDDSGNPPSNSPFVPVSGGKEGAEVILPDEQPATSTPFEPVAKSQEPEITLPPESSSTSQESPFRAFSPEKASASPFAPVNPAPSGPLDQDLPPAKGLDALAGGTSSPASISPFAKQEPEGEKSIPEEKPTPFKPVGEGGLPPKRFEVSPFSPAPESIASPFEKAAAPGASTEGRKAEPPSPSPATPPNIPRSREAGKPEASPFSPVEPAPATPPISPFAPAAKAASDEGETKDDEDKVDELLRQFKERYGRD